MRRAEDLIRQSTVTIMIEADNLSVTVNTFDEYSRQQAKVVPSDIGKVDKPTWDVLRSPRTRRTPRMLPRHIPANEAPHTLLQSRPIIRQQFYSHYQLTVLKMPVRDWRERRVQHGQRVPPDSNTRRGIRCQLHETQAKLSPIARAPHNE